MRTIRWAYIIVSGLFLIAFSLQSVRAGSITSFLDDYMADRTLDQLWDRAKGKLNVIELDRGLMIAQDTLSRQDPSLGLPLQNLRARLRPDMNKEDLRRLIHEVDRDLCAQLANLEARGSITQAQIAELKRRIAEIAAANL
jgi:hypothetical protein